MAATTYTPKPGDRIRLRRTVDGVTVAVATGTISVFRATDNGHYLELANATNPVHNGGWHIGTSRGRLTGQTVVTTVEPADA